MNRRARYWTRRILMGSMVLMIGYALYTTVTNEKKKDPPSSGEPAPDFQLKTLDGGTVKLSDLRGKGVLINFWATWCSPCRKEIPAMQKVYEKYKDRGFEVVAVNIAETKPAISGFTRQLGLTLPVVLDRDREVTNLYNVGPIPSSFFISPEGKIVKHITGQMDEIQIEYQVNQVLP